MPLYHQLKQALRSQIEAGALQPGDRLDGERQLMETYGVSRITVRQALGELVSEGILTRQHGRGTFVAPRKIAQPLARLQGFAEELQQRGLVPQVSLLVSRVQPADPLVAGKLQLPPRAQVVEVRRLIAVDGEPLLVDTSVLPESIGRMVIGLDLTRVPIYNALETLGFRIREGEQAIESAIAAPEDARLLGIQRTRVPVLRIERVTLAEAGTPVEYSRAIYRGDRYRYEMRLQRRGGADLH